MQLGRHGDLINLLPLWWRLHQQSGQRPRIVTRPDYLPLLAGASYVEAIPFDGRIDDPAAALAWARKNYLTHEIIVSQYENNPVDSRRLTPCYQMESWRLAGALDEFGKWPLVLEHDDDSAALRGNIGDIVVAAQSISSPFPDEALMDALLAEFGGRITRIDDMRMPNPQCMIPYLNAASVLVTVDTMHIHLARAAKVPVVAILQDRPHLGSVPPPACVAKFGYAEAANDLGRVVEAVRGVVDGEEGVAVWLASHIHGHTDRHIRARETWRASRLQRADPSPDRVAAMRTAAEIGDPRPLRYLKDVLRFQLEYAASRDVILWINDDIALSPEIRRWCETHIPLYGAASMRRSDDHIGRDLFAFTAKWLRDNWDELPDYIIGTCDWDMGLAAMIRAKRGIVTCLGNVGIDFYPCDATERLYTHEEHPSEWNVPNVASVPSVRHNRECFRRWAERYCPGIKFYPDGLLR